MTIAGLCVFADTVLTGDSAHRFGTDEEYNNTDVGGSRTCPTPTKEITFTPILSTINTAIVWSSVSLEVVLGSNCSTLSLATPFIRSQLSDLRDALKIICISLLILIITNV